MRSAATASGQASIPTTRLASGPATGEARTGAGGQSLFRLHRRGTAPESTNMCATTRSTGSARCARCAPTGHRAGAGNRLRGPQPLDPPQVGRRHAVSAHLAAALGQARGRGRPAGDAAGDAARLMRRYCWASPAVDTRISTISIALPPSVTSDTISIAPAERPAPSGTSTSNRYSDCSTPTM
jgi:hypothetical protein